MPTENDIDELQESSVDTPDEIKPNKKRKKIDLDKKKKKGSGKIIGLFITAVVIAAIVWIFGFNGLGLREKYIFPFLRTVPIVNNIIPKAEEKDDEYKDKSRNAIISENISLKAKIEKLEAEKDELNTKISDDKKEIARLKIFETEQLKFRQDKKEFDEQIAGGDEISYKEFYEDIYPENAQEIYEKIVRGDVSSKEFKNYISTFENMKKESAAKILEKLIGSDMDLVVTILSNLSNDQRSNILSAMSPENAAACVKRLSPQ